MADQQIDIPGVGVVAFPDSMSDADISAAAAKLHADAQPKAAPKWYQPGGDVLLDHVRAAPGAVMGVLRTAAQHPIQTGAALGGALAVPFTAGTSALLPAVAAAGLGGAGGAGLGTMAAAAMGNPDTPNTAGDVLGTMGKQGAIQAAAEGGGRLLTKGLHAAGSALYRTALGQPAASIAKYGDLTPVGLAEGAPIGSSRAVQGSMQSSKAAIDQMAQGAEHAGRTVPTSAVTDQFMPLLEKAANREGLGVLGDAEEIAQRERLFTAAHPTGQIAPTQGLALKREADALSGTAQNALRRGVATNDMTAQLTDATRSGLNQGLATATEGLTGPTGLDYTAQNARTRDLFGLSRALRAAENRPHRLTDILSLLSAVGGAVPGGGSSTGRGERGLATGALVRAAASPVLQSHAGLALDAASTANLPNLIRAALLAQMAGSSESQP